MVVVVTGGKGATAKGLIEYFKFRAKAVVGTLRNLDSRWKEKDGIYFTKCDLLENDEVEGAIELIMDRLGGPHVWINAVGGFIMGNKVEDCLNEWDKMYQLNFQTLFLKYLFLKVLLDPLLFLTLFLLSTIIF